MSENQKTDYKYLFFNECYTAIKKMDSKTFKKNFYLAKADIEIYNTLFFTEYTHKGPTYFQLLHFEPFSPKTSYEKSRDFIMKYFNLNDSFWDDYEKFTIGLYLRNKRRVSRINLGKKTGLSIYKIDLIENFYYLAKNDDVIKYLKGVKVIDQEGIKKIDLNDFNSKIIKLWNEKDAII